MAFTLDAQGQVDSWNAGAERLTGHSRGQIIGQPFAALYSEADAAEQWPRRSLAVALREGRHTDQGPRRRRDGDLFWADQTLTPRVTTADDGSDAVSGFTCVLRDITERVGTTPGHGMSSALVEQALESVADAIVTIDERQRITLFNRAAEQLFGRARGDVLGKPFSLLTTAPIPARSEPARAEPERIAGMHAGGHTLPLEALRTDSDVNGRHLTTVVFRDLTTQLLAAAADARSRDLEARLTGIAQSVPGALFSFRRDAAGNLSFPYMSPGTLRVLGLAPEVVVADAQAGFGRVFADDLPALMASIERSAETLTAWEHDFRYLHESEGIIWIAGVAAPMRTVDDCVLWHGFLLDATRLKRAEDAAVARGREAEQALSRLHAVMQTVTDGTIVTDRQGRIIEVNAPVLRIFDAQDDDILARDSQAVYAEIELARLDGSVLPFAEWPRQRVLGGETLRGLELRVAHRPTARHWIMRFSGGPVHGADGEVELAVISIEDVTSQRATEGALAESEARLQMALRAGRLGVWDWSAGTGEVYLSGEAARMLGAPGQRCTLADAVRCLDPQDVTQVIGIPGRDASAPPKLPTDVEFRSRPAEDGSVRWFHSLAHYEFDASGQLSRALGTLGDITERKRADAELAASEARWRALADAMPEAVFEINLAGEIVYVNRHAAALRGTPDATALDWQAALHPDDRLEVAARWAGALATGEPLQYEARILHADGRHRWMLMRAVAIRGDDGAIARWYATASDIDELKRMHEALGEREQRLQMALRAGGLGVWDWDPQARLLTLSDAAAEIVGQAPGVHGADALLPLIHPDDLEKARGEELLKASPSVPRTAFDVELRAQRGDGELRWFRVLASYVFDARGRFVRALGTVGDVTGRRRASDALLARERELRDLAEAVPHAVMVMDGSGRVLFRNALSTRLFDPARPDDMNEAIHPEDRAAVWQLFDRRSLAGRVPVTEGGDGDGDGAAAAEVLAIECRLRLHGAQEYRWYLGRALCVRDADGTVLRWYATATDIHANKVTEAALRERETRLRLAVAASRLGVWEWREESASFAWSDDCRAILGMTTMPETREAVLAALHPDDVPAALSLWSVTVDSRDAHAVTLRYVGPSGALRWLQVHAHCEFGAAGDAVRMIGTLQDITDAVVAERARALQSDVDRTLANASTMAQLLQDGLQVLCRHTGASFATLWEVEPGTDALRCSEAFAVADGVDARVLAALAQDCRDAPALALGAGFPDLAAAGHAAIPATLDLAHCAARLPTGNRAARLGLGGAILLPIVVDGVTAGVVELFARTATPLADGLYEQLAFVANQLGQAMQRLRVQADIGHFVSGSPVAVYAQDLRAAPGRRAWHSENTGALLGYDNAAVALGDWWLERVHPDDREKVRRSRSADALPAGGNEHDVLEYRFRRGDDSWLWLRDARRMHHDARGAATEVIGSLIDVTERVKLEDELRQAQKMEAVGRLAGGIAHDFNNLLTVIGGYGELMLQGLQVGDPLRAYVTGIRQAGERATQLTRQLLAFSRKQVLEPRVLDLNGVVTDIERMLQRLIGEDIRLATTLPSLPWLVKVDRGQMEQVLLNLVVNARDAMPDGGELRVSTAAVECTPEWCRQHAGFAPGRYVRLRVEDSGTGMTTDVQARMFEPYFTTKREGKGTGLGLSTVFGIVSQSGGHILVDSQPGRGTRCDVYLPVVDDEAMPTGEPVQRASRGGRERILLVEDEPAVRAVARQALESFGYRVHEAAGAEAALDLLRRSEQPFDLLVTDIVMPGMSGHALAEAVTELDPQVRVLYISGYSDGARIQLDLERTQRAFLQKPFSLATLQRKVREVLDDAPGPAEAAPS